MITRPRWLFVALSLCAAASGCSDDDGNVAGCGAGTLCLDAAVHTDAQVSDAAPLDGSSNVCSASGPRIDDTYQFRDFQGLASEDYYSELSDSSYRRLQEQGKLVNACSSPLAVCGSEAVDHGDLAAALANADVVAAFAAAGPNLELVFGRFQSFDDDISQFTITKGLSKRYGVGRPCTGAASCREIPAGVTALVKLLRQLNDEQGRAGPCAGFPASPDAGTPADSGTLTLGLDAGP